MNIAVVVECLEDVSPMRGLLAKGGISVQVLTVCVTRPTTKPTMKLLRTVDRTNLQPFDYIIASGETAARWVLDTSTVNINRLRGRDIDYVETKNKTKN